MLRGPGEGPRGPGAGGPGERGCGLEAGGPGERGSVPHCVKSVGCIYRRI